jgi:hypothetical protein
MAAKANEIVTALGVGPRLRSKMNTAPTISRLVSALSADNVFTQTAAGSAKQIATALTNAPQPKS